MATMTMSPRVTSAQRTVVSTPSSSQRRSDAAVSSSIRLTKRGRRLARTTMFVLALLITVSSAIFGHISASQASSAHTPAVATSVVIVQPGQTMWGLAAQVAPNDDPRDTIERIAQLNSLTGAQSSTVYPGQRLVVPATA